ncbi:MAG: hypothetical protein COV10_01360 [Candidatus Vogelbacteria bacterium CG10_big_fil_rev_8_21_14_0_10_51_16]|uniref:Lactamase n=1 Tax=Candidatus Vogelbacteria bacterium CG10_big_fil_rev_8_21_14_0_10_51_16 TaxID=1975045 RepID=A0A2H0RET3_9BACT|nr:MAG: hypothetical protein COV10_01360 [Candidatus Vogelbacteria bacterium CG10_big_fil_rev_8_21_14_0_10_51_16]
MVITYYGLAACKVQYSSTVLAFSPVSKKSSYRASTFGADLALIAVNHPDYNGRDQVAFGSKEPFVIDGPGEYEVNGIYVRGFGVLQKKPKEEGGTMRVNTIYSVLFEGVNLCHLGCLDSKELAPEVTESLGEIDVLFLPIFKNTLDDSVASKLANTLNPKIVVPLYDDHDTGEKSLSQFLKESGRGGLKPEDRLTLRKKDLEGKVREVVLLEPNGKTA